MFATTLILDGIKNLNQQIYSLATNVPTVGEEADLKAHTFSLVQMPVESTNVEFSTKPAFLPNVCYAFGLF